MNAVDLLKEDHRKLQGILEDISATTTKALKKRETLFQKAKDELIAHEAIEEELFYPILKENSETRSLALEAYEEHHCANNIIAELNDLSFDDETWIAKFTVLQENLNHHIKEEEKEIFKKAKGILSKQELAELGEQMQKMKKINKKSSL
jgi:hemerythrin-like domain-containing protein